MSSITTGGWIAIGLACTSVTFSLGYILGALVTRNKFEALLAELEQWHKYKAWIGGDR